MASDDGGHVLYGQALEELIQVGRGGLKERQEEEGWVYICNDKWGIEK